MLFHKERSRFCDPHHVFNRVVVGNDCAPTIGTEFDRNSHVLNMRYDLKMRFGHAANIVPLKITCDLHNILGKCIGS
jgi:hypothetical protein